MCSGGFPTAKAGKAWKRLSSMSTPPTRHAELTGLYGLLMQFLGFSCDEDQHSVPARVPASAELVVVHQRELGHDAIHQVRDGLAVGELLCVPGWDTASLGPIDQGLLDDNGFLAQPSLANGCNKVTMVHDVLVLIII